MSELSHPWKATACNRGAVAQAGFSKWETAQSCGFRDPKELLFSSFPKDVGKKRNALKLLKSVAVTPVKIGEMKSISNVKLLSLLLDKDRQWVCMYHTTAQTLSDQWFSISDTYVLFTHQAAWTHSDTVVTHSQEQVLSHPSKSPVFPQQHEDAHTSMLSTSRPVWYFHRLLWAVTKKATWIKAAFLGNFFYCYDKEMLCFYEEIIYTAQLLQAEGKSLAWGDWEVVRTKIECKDHNLREK